MKNLCEGHHDTTAFNSITIQFYRECLISIPAHSLMPQHTQMDDTPINFQPKYESILHHNRSYVDMYQF